MGGDKVAEEGMTRISYRVPTELHTELKLICAKERKPLQQYLDELVGKDLEQRGIKIPVNYAKTEG